MTSMLEGLRCKCPLFLSKLGKNKNPAKRELRKGNSGCRILIPMQLFFFSMTISIKINNPSFENGSESGIASCHVEWAGWRKDILGCRDKTEVGIWKHPSKGFPKGKLWCVLSIYLLNLLNSTSRLLILYI